MQILKKFFIISLVSCFALLAFMPKQEIYYKLEETLAEKNIKINEESMEEGIFSLSIVNAEIYVKGIKVAKVDRINFFTLLFYTKINVENLLVDESLSNKLPTDIKHILVTYLGFNPYNVGIEAEGSFGGLEGNANLNTRVLRVDFNDSTSIEMLKPQLTQGEEGWYYETSF